MDDDDLHPLWALVLGLAGLAGVGVALLIDRLTRRKP